MRIEVSTNADSDSWGWDIFDDSGNVIASSGEGVRLTWPDALVGAHAAMHRIATAHLRRFHIPPPPAQKIVAMPKNPVDLTGAEA